MLLAPSDVFYFEAETPRLTSRWATAMEVVGEGRGPLAVEELRAHLASVLPRTPWAEWRVALPRHRVGRYRWVDASPVRLEEMVLDEHPSASIDCIEAYMATLVTQPLGLALPPWRLRLVTLADGRQFIVSDAHHSLGGSYVSVDMLARWFGGDDSPPPPAVWTPQRLSIDAQLRDAAWRVAAACYRTAVRRRRRRPLAPPLAGSPLVGPVGATRAVQIQRLPMSRVGPLCAAYGVGETRMFLALLSRALEDLAPATDELRAMFPRGTLDGPVSTPGNAARGSFLLLPLHRPFEDRLAAILESIAADEPSTGADVDVTISMQLPMPTLSMGDRELRWIGSAGPLRLGANPVSRLSVLVQRHRDDVHFMFTVDRDGLGHELPGICARLVSSLDDLGGHADDALLSA